MPSSKRTRVPSHVCPLAPSLSPKWLVQLRDHLPREVVHVLGHALVALHPRNLQTGKHRGSSALIAAAKNANSLAAADLPFSLTLDTSFWMWIVGKAPSFWYDLPNEFKDDPAWVKAIGFFRSKAMVQDVFDRFPLLAADRGMWHTLLLQFERPEIRLALEEFYYEYPELVRDLAPIHTAPNRGRTGR